MYLGFILYSIQNTMIRRGKTHENEVTGEKMEKGTGKIASKWGKYH